MSKFIEVTSLKNGFGKSTLTSLLAIKLAELDYRVLVIGNQQNNGDLSKYLLTDCKYGIDDLRPHLDANMLEGQTIKLMAAKVNANLDFLDGSKTTLVDNTLKPEDLAQIKGVINNIYDYVIVDSDSRIGNIPELVDVIDIPIIVTVPVDNRHHYLSQTNELSVDAKNAISDYLKKSILLVNFYDDALAFKAKNFKKHVAKDNILRFNYSTNVINFCNGLKCELEERNQKELINLVGKITNESKAEQLTKKSNKFNLLSKLIRDKLKTS